MHKCRTETSCTNHACFFIASMVSIQCRSPQRISSPRSYYKTKQKEVWSCQSNPTTVERRKRTWCAFSKLTNFFTYCIKKIADGGTVCEECFARQNRKYCFSTSLQYQELKPEIQIYCVRDKPTFHFSHWVIKSWEMQGYRTANITV